MPVLHLVYIATANLNYDDFYNIPRLLAPTALQQQAKSSLHRTWTFRPSISAITWIQAWSWETLTRTLVSAKLVKDHSKARCTTLHSPAGGSNTTGSFDFETKLDWRWHLAMPFIQLEAGVNHTEKTTKVRAIVKGGPSMDLHSHLQRFWLWHFCCSRWLGFLRDRLEWRKKQYSSLKGHIFNSPHNITNEILFVERRGHSEKQKIFVDGEGELGLGLDGKGEIFDSRDGMYWVVWSGSCRGSSEDGCARFGIPEIRNLTLFINTSGYQDSMLHMFERFQNVTDPTGLELDKDKIIIFGFWNLKEQILFWSWFWRKFSPKPCLHY